MHTYERGRDRVWSFFYPPPPVLQPIGSWVHAHVLGMVQADWVRDLNHSYCVGTGLS